MTTLPEQLMNAEGTELRRFWREYYSETLRHIVNEQLNEAILKLGVSKAELAKRLGKRPEQITRWLSSPCNLELETLSDLALALGLRVHTELNPIESPAVAAGQGSEPSIVYIEVSSPEYIRTSASLATD
jgi:ribosome-binding protein aMBF1 (putative translation factor)